MHRPSISSAFTFVCAAALAGSGACTRGEPPTAAIDGAVAPLAASPSVTQANANANANDASTSGAALLDASEPTPRAAPNAPDASLVTGGSATSDIGEQTRDVPSAKSPAFTARAAALWDAIASDDPARARDTFFPVRAYEKVKAVGNPAGDWRVRLLAAYERDIHDLHRELGARASRARYVGIDVPEERARWVEPGEEYNKLGYYRVFGSRLKFEVDGRERSFLVKSLISWRGEWFVVHLSAMK